MSVEPPNKPSSPIQRFSRYPFATDIGEMAKKMWKRPKFRVEENANETEFIFRLKFNIPRKIKKKEVAFHALLCDPNRTPLRRALKQAYRDASYGSENAEDLCERALFRVFAGSLAILFKEANDSEGPYKG